MKKYFSLLAFMTLFFYQPVFAQQFSITGGLGVDLTNHSSLNDYISRRNGERRADFNPNAEFFGEFGYVVNDEFQIGAEYAYSVNSYNSSNVGYYDLSYNGHLPSLLAYYLISGKGYRFKFGGGTGYRYYSISEVGGISTQSLKYSASGFGFLLRADGNTTLGGNLYADISLQMRMDFVGEPKAQDGIFRNNFAEQNVNLNSFSVGLRLGLSYYF
jgi:hypothetical protein